MEAFRGIRRIPLALSCVVAACGGGSGGAGSEEPVSMESPAAIAAGRYQLRSVYSGLCVEIEGASIADGAKTRQAICSDADAQRFEMQPAADGTYNFINVRSGKGLDVSDISLADGALIQQWSYGGGANQRFAVSGDDSALRIQARHTGKCLDVKDFSTAVGGRIQQWTCGNGNNQRWQLLAVGAPPPPPPPPPPPQAGGADAITAAHASRIVQRYRGVWSSPPARTATDQTTDAPLLGNGDLGVAIAGSIDAMTFELSKTEFWSLAEGRVKAMARLNLSIPAMAGASHGMAQELATAQAVGSFSLGGNTLSTTSWVQATDTANNLLLTRLVYSGTQSKPVTVSFAPGVGNSFPARAGVSGDILYFDVRADGSDQVGGVNTRKVRLATRVIGATATVQGNTLSFTLAPGGTYTLATSVVSLNDNPNWQSVALGSLATKTAADIAGLQAAHAAWWNAFYQNSFVEIGNKTIEKQWYASLYLLGSSSRPDEAAPGLWGAWIGNNPAWNGDYTLNYNYETPFYMALPTNHIDLAKAYDKPVLDWLPNAQALAQARGWKGAYYRVHIGPLPNGSSDTNEWNQKFNGAYAASNMVQRYLYTRDTAYANAGVYNFVKQVATFWQDYLVFDGTRYVITNDAQHEGDPNPQTNGVMSLGLVRQLLQGAIEMSADLNVDAAQRAAWQDILARLSAFPTQVRNGQTVFRYTEVGLDWNNGNSIGIQHIYPGSQVGLDSEAQLLQTSRNMVDQMARWGDGNGANTFYPAAARVGYNPATILSQLGGFIAGNTYPNLHLHTGGGGIENLNTVPATLSEMFVQGFQGKLRVFANWPAGQDAKFGDLRAYGAFLVSSDLRGNAVQYVRVISEKGRSLVLRNPWPGQSLALYRNGVAAGSLSGTDLAIPTSAGEVLHVAPAGVSYSQVIDRMKAAGPGTGGGSGLLAGAIATADAACASNEGPDQAINGVVTDKWCSNAHLGAQWLALDLGSSKAIGRWVVKHAQAGGEPAAYNTRNFKLQKSADGLGWADVDTVANNTAAVTDRTVAPFSARFVRLLVTTPTQSSDAAARIYELELH